MPIKLLVADDHPAIRSGLFSLLSGTDIKVVAEASTATETVKMAGKHKPDVVLLDVRLGKTDGLEAIETIRTKLPKTRVVVLSTYDSPTYIARAAALGASDYLLKGRTGKELVASIRAAAKGLPPAGYGELKRVAAAMNSQEPLPGLDVRLAPRQLQTLRHVAFGLSYKEIGQSMGIRRDAVKEHIQKLLRQLKMNDRTQLAVWAIKHGFVD